MNPKRPAQIRTGACKIVEVFADDFVELSARLDYVEEEIRRRAAGIPIYLQRLCRIEIDRELDAVYWYGVILYDHFLGGWMPIERFDPENGVYVVDFREKVNT